jgi:putative flippase GtrA
MSTIQRSRLGAERPAAEPARRPPLRELLGFPLIGTIGTVVTVGGANLMRGLAGDSPVTTTIVPTIVATLMSYLAHRYWTFRHRESDGSGREVVVFFGLNAVGMAIQLVCSGFVYHTLGVRHALGLSGAVAYNLALLAGLGAASLFRYWSYKKWVFTPAAL